MQEAEVELEEAVGTLSGRLDRISDDRILLSGISTKDLKRILTRVQDFIDFCKFSFGEDITKTK